MGANLGKPQHAAKGSPSVMIEFTDILLTTTLPVHPALAADPRLFISLIEDENIYAETPVINGDLATGIWDINSSLSADSVKQSVTLAVFTSRKGARFRLASVRLSVSELLARSEARSDGYQEFHMHDPESSMQLIMTCTVNVLPSLIMNSPPSDASIIHDNHTVNRRAENSHLDHEPNSSRPLSREYLESSYATISSLPNHNELKASSLSGLGRLYHALYQKEDDGADLEKVILPHEDALQCTGSFHPRLAEDAHMLSLALMRHFEQSGDTVGIDRAISYLQNTLNFTEDVDIEKSGLLDSLGGALHRRFFHLDDVSDLQKAVSFMQQAVNMTAGGDPEKPSRLSNLGIALQSRFERLGDLGDLEDGISNKLRAVELTPDNHPDKPRRLSSLGNALESRSKRLGDLEDLEHAVSNHRRAVELRPQGDPNNPNRLTDFVFSG